MSDNKIVLSNSSFKVLSVEDTIKLYTPNLTDNDIKAFVWYNRTLGIPMTGYEKWFIYSEKRIITAKEDIECLNQQYEPIGKIQKGDEVGKVTRFENEYKGITYVAVRRFDNSLCLVDKSKIDLDASKYEAPKQELDELVKSFSLMYIDGMYLPLHVYTNTDYDILKLNLERDKNFIIQNYGQEVFDYHANIISGFTRMQVNHPIKANRFKLNPFGEIAREVKIVDEDGRETNISEGFLEWTRTLKASDYELVTREVFRERIVYNGTSRGKFSNLDKDEKEEANKREKADAELECERLFSEYLTNIIDSDTQKVLNKRINEVYNQSLKINTSKIPVGFVCSNKFKKANFTLRDVQIEAFKFSVSRNNFCLALTVGFGKTSVAISILSYLIGTGTIKKPLVVVPKPVLKNWQKEMFGYYTNGKTFSFTEVEGWTFEYGILTNCGIDFTIINNLSKKYRSDALKLQQKQKCITLASYEALEKMYIGDEDVRLFVINVWKGLLEQSFAKDETEKESAKKISTLISRLNKVDKDAEVDIMKLGFDSIYFDEAHRLKNLFSGVSADKTNRISSGFKGNPSNRSLRAFYLTQYLQKIKGRIGFLTATPFSNSPLEVYTMLVFLNFTELVKNNVFKIKNFVEIFFNETLEYKVNQSNKIVSESVMKNYKNKPILYKILSNTFIYKDDPKSAGIKRPCLITYPNKKIPLMLSQSPLQELQRDALTGKLQDTEYYINKYPEVEPYVDEFLSQFSRMSSTESRLGMKGKILMSSKSSALSPFAQSPLMLPFVSDEQWKEVYEFSPKIKFCVDAIKYIIDYHESRKEKCSSFLIYMEFGVNILPQVKEALENVCKLQKKLSFSLSNEEEDDDDDIKGGKIYYDEVEIIDGSADSEKEANRRERVAQLFNRGLVKVIIGTSTIKEGINLQENSATEFILTPSWNSTDINQVIGRIHRQGNRFPLVRVIMPVVSRTLDSFIFQKYEEKKSRLNDVWQDNEVSTTEADDVNISADKQKELILNDANEIAGIRIDMLKKKEINEYNKIKDEYDALEKAISKSDMYKYYTNYFSSKLSDMLALAESNQLNLKILLDYINKGNAEPTIARKKDRIALLFDYYIDLIETIKKAIDTKQSTDIINIFKGNFKRRDYNLTFDYYDEDNFKKVANFLRLQNVEWLLNEDIFRPLGVSKKTKYYNDTSFESIYDLIQINAECLNSEKFILNPEGVSLSSPNEDLQKILQKYQDRISSKIASIEKNFEIINNYRGFELISKDSLKEQLVVQAKIELDGENKLALLGDKLASYFAQKTNHQLSYTYNNVDIDKCDIPSEEMDIESMKLESINVDEIPKDYSKYKKIYEKLSLVVTDIDDIKIGFTAKVGKSGDSFMPLSVEMQDLYDEQNILGKYGTRLIMEQNYVQNGDLMTDPRIDFAIYKEDKIAIPINYENNGMGIYTEYIKEGKIVDLKNLNGTIKFCIDIWFKNLVEQDRVIGTKKVVEVVKDESGQVKSKKQRLDINTIGDKFFKENPSHILGEMSISDFRGQIIVKGSKQDVIDYFDKELVDIKNLKVENAIEQTNDILKQNQIEKIVDDFVKKLKSKGVNVTSRKSKNGIFIYGEKRPNGNYKYETYFSFEEIPNEERLELEESEFLRLHNIKNETKQTNEVLQPTKGESITTKKVSEVKRTTEEREYLTNEKEIIDAVVELASKSKSDVAFIKNITTIGSNFGLDITSNEFINALGLKKGDVEYNKRKLKNIYLTQGLNLKKQIKEKQKELKAEAFLSNIENMAKNANDEMESEIKKKDSKSEILEAIEALEILAEMGNQEAVEAIDALKILLD